MRVYNDGEFLLRLWRFSYNLNMAEVKKIDCDKEIEQFKKDGPYTCKNVQRLAELISDYGYGQYEFKEILEEVYAKFSVEELKQLYKNEDFIFDCLNELKGLDHLVVDTTSLDVDQFAIYRMNISTKTLFKQMNENLFETPAQRARMLNVIRRNEFESKKKSKKD